MGTGYRGKKAMADSRDDWFYRNCAGWQLKFALLPTRCDLTGSIIWLKYGYMGTGILTGPGESIIERRWHDKDQHLIWKIKGH